MSRQFGKLYSQIREISNILNQGKTVGVAGLKDPEKYIEKFRELGIEVDFEPMKCKEPNQFIIDEREEIIDIKYGEIIQTGYIFSLKK